MHKLKDKKIICFWIKLYLLNFFVQIENIILKPINSSLEMPCRYTLRNKILRVAIQLYLLASSERLIYGLYEISDMLINLA